MKPSLILSLLLLVSHGIDAAPRSWQQPNFVLLVAADLGREWLGCYGGEEIGTPEMDRLAANGLRFEACYAGAMPSISRVELLTGRYPFRTGWMWENDVPRFGPPELEPGREFTFARLLKAVGYQTAFAGVWGLNKVPENAASLRMHGFDASRVTTDLAAVESHVGGFMEAVKETPFCVCAFLPPVLESSGFREHVLAIDGMVGRLTAKLRELELDRRTVVILTAAGGTDGLEARAWDGQRVKGGRGTLLEVGINVPLIISGSYWVKRGQVTRDLVDLSDLMPTVVDLAGGRLPKGLELDGRVCSDLLSGRGLTQPREWIMAQHGHERVIRNARYKLYSNGRCYDVVADPLERHNLARSSNSEMIGERERLAMILRSLPEDRPLAFPYASRMIVRRPR
jgi:arylsulfatase A-like enzyme